MYTLVNSAKDRSPVRQGHRQLHRRYGWIFAAVLWLALSPTSAWAWWNHDWSYRKPIVLDGTAKGASLAADLNNITVLVRLHDGVFKFADANPDGSDLRFVAGDDKTPLKYHVEKFDSVFNLAFVWVTVPTMKANAATTIYMYWGNSKAAAESDTRGTFDADQVLVYHFGERGTPVTDATGFANSSKSVVGVDESSLIGTGAKFDGSNSVGIPGSPSLQVAAGAPLTWSVWIKPARADEDGVLYARHDGANSLVIGLAKGVPYASVSGQQVAAAQPLGNANWHHLAITAGQTLALFVDGVAGPTAPLPLPAMNGPAQLGGDAAGGGTGYVGEMDELEISKTARAPAYLHLAALNQGVNDKLVGFGADEQLSTWSSGYLAIILKSVTLDGWVVIGILFFMMAVSWTVMARKGMRLGGVTRGNRGFLRIYESASGDFDAVTHLIRGTAVAQGIEVSERTRRSLQASTLFHIFKAGMEELRRRIGDDPKQRASACLSPQSIEAMRASLDAAQVRENQSLNSQIVLLTIAISGGPFLGLLGTVVGVMTTFAAIAASGDVNVNSIAPGISAALAATVAGLLVAIPALFGYNYLLTRIKDISAQTRVFADELITRIAENYDVSARAEVDG